MSNMTISHQKTITADGGKAIACSTVDGDIFAQGSAVTNYDTSGFVFVAQVLRFKPDSDPGKEAAILTNSGVPINDSMTANTGACTNHDIFTNDGIRLYYYCFVELGPTMDDGSGMYQSKVTI
jgi:hypothetical protein